MLMAMIVYETVFNAIYESEFIKNNSLAYYLTMSDLRNRIQEELDKRGWNQTNLAEKSKVPQPTIQRFMSGLHGEPRSATIKKIASGFGLTEAELRFNVIDTAPNGKPESNAEWLGGFDLWDSNTPLDDDEVALPFFREVKLSAGSGSTEVIENHGCKLRFAKSTLKKQGVQAEHGYCATVKGNSMEPVLPDGCTIGVDISKTTVANGDWYAIDHHGELRVKVMYRMPGGGYRLRSFNSDEWPDEQVPEDAVRILGRVFWWSGLR